MGKDINRNITNESIQTERRMKVGHALRHQEDMQISDGGPTGTLGHCWGIQNGTASLRDSEWFL